MSIIIVPELASAYVCIYLEVLEIPEPGQQQQRQQNATTGSDSSSSSSLALQELLTFCEIVSRTALVHELRITPYSLGAAVARGMTPKQVIACLKRHARPGQDQPAVALGLDEGSKPKVDWQRLAFFVTRCMNSFLRARLVVRGGGDAVVECNDKAAYDLLTGDPQIQSMMSKNQDNLVPQQQNQQQQQNQGDDEFESIFLRGMNNSNNSSDLFLQQQNELLPDEKFYFRLQDVQSSNYVIARSFNLGLPLSRQYDYLSDTGLRRTALTLRPTAQPRPYQRAAVESAFGSGRLSSGVIVIPCGGGKTLVGVMCIAAVRRPTVILCVNALSVDQWKEQIDRFACLSSTSTATAANAPAARQQTQQQQQQSSATSSTAGGTARIALWTAKRKDQITKETDVVITTYHALAGLARRRTLQEAAASAAPGANNHKAAAAAAALRKNHDEAGDDDDDPFAAAAKPVAPGRSASAFQKDKLEAKRAAIAAAATTATGKKARGSTANQSAVQPHPLLDWSWGLVILDEAHVVPATYFRDGVNAIAAKASIGLTATFVREDDKIGDLQHICGPKLFDIGWETLRDAGYLASVQCHEVIIPLPVIFQQEYWNRRAAFAAHQEDIAMQFQQQREQQQQQQQKAKRKAPQAKKSNKKKNSRRNNNDDDDDDEDEDEENRDEYDSSSSSDDDDNVVAAVAAGHAGLSKQQAAVMKKKAGNLHPVLIALAASNPNKILCAKAIVERHRGQKILLFCDIISLLQEYADQLKCPAIHGGIPHNERVRLFSDFENSSSRNVLCVSRVGEIAINLPSARVVIQVSSHGGSRRQEAQRLGRVLRPKLGTTATTASDADGSNSNGNCGNVSNFYSLVSADTLEVEYAARRMHFLIDQGYQTDQEFWQPEPYDEDKVREEREAAALLIAERKVTKEEAAAAAVKDETTAAAKSAASKQQPKQKQPSFASVIDIRTPEWTVAWLAKVIARWELDSAGPLAQGKRRGRGGVDVFNDPSLDNFVGGELDRQTRAPIARWTTGTENAADRVVYDEM